MYIYAEKITPRLTYIANTLFAGIKITYTNSAAEFYEAEGVKINYSKKKFSDAEFLIIPSGLLYEEKIKNQNLQFSEWEGLKIFFATNGDIPFDFFSAAFYLLSRYEEYLPHKKDSYGRFAHQESIAFKEGFLNIPLVNLWMQQLKILLQRKFTEFKSLPEHFTFIPTYDIDIAYAYKGKSIVRKLISKIKGEQVSINGKDVFDVYEWLDEMHNQFGLRAKYFFLLAERKSKYDKNLSPKSTQLRKLIKTTALKYELGIHPSWSSYFDETILHKEIKTLAAISKKYISSSRQHYIQFTLPATFRSLVAAGITDDYSMGYGSINGFRASYTSSFYWYDLMKEETTKLLLHPFCFMEANACFEQKLSAPEALTELQQFYNVVKQVNGKLIIIFHNHFLTQQPQWNAWREMYQHFLSNASPGGSTPL